MMDSDEIAILESLLLEQQGVPYRYVVEGDGVNWISVKVVRGEEAKQPCQREQGR